MRNVLNVLAAVTIMSIGIALANATTFVQHSQMPASGIFAALLGLAALLALACPPMIGGAWMLNRYHEDRFRRTAGL